MAGEAYNNDALNNSTPYVPGGAYDFGSGKTYSAFTVEDVIEGGSKRITRGLWSGNSGELTSFWTSSYQSDTQKQYYYEIYNGDPTDSNNEPQFSIAYGHRAGSGSLGTNEDSPSKAIYSQMAQVLLPSNQTTFQFGCNSYASSDDVYVISINRARLKDKLDPGNWELVLSGSNGTTYKFIDNSGDVNQTGNSTESSYSVVSGSITNGAYNTTEVGKAYPQFGIIVLDTKWFGVTNNIIEGPYTTVADNQNQKYLFNAISGAAAANSDNGFQARSEEEVKSTYFFVRAKNSEYNFSNNPSFVSGSQGRLTQPTFIGDPKTYITTVGLYNNDNELLAIAKLSKPILKSYSNEVLIKVKLDF